MEWAGPLGAGHGDYKEQKATRPKCKYKRSFLAKLYCD